MKTHKALTREAEELLKIFAADLGNIKGKALKIKKRFSYLPLLPVMAIAVWTGYSIFKNSPVKNPPAPTDSKTPLLPKHEKDSVFSFWFRRFANELLMIFLGNWVVNFLKKL
jgi:hypothetical protein